jgi:hypothetical protein
MVLLVGVLACAGGAVRGSGADRNRLTGTQIRETDAVNLYYAIERLRPQWLGSRGPTSASDPTPTVAHVFVNGTMAGNTEVLREIKTLEVEEVRFLTPGQAAARYGMGHPRGVIEATLRRR